MVARGAPRAAVAWVALAALTGAPAVVIAGAVAAPVAAAPVGGAGGRTSLDLAVPAYRGLEPELRLSYDPAGGNGWLGVGWSLAGLSEIVRQSPGRGAPAYDGTDRFFLNAMELVPCPPAVVDAGKPESPACRFQVPGATATYTTRVEGYRRVSFTASAAGGRWLVENPDGRKLTYQPRLTHFPAGAPDGWHLAGVEDPLGNRVTYHYRHDADPLGSGQEYPADISYNGVVIRFRTEARPDPVDAGDGSTLIVGRRRLRTVEVTSGGEPVRAYGLEYANPASATGRSMLRTVREYGRDVALDAAGRIIGGTAAPPVTLSTESGGAGAGAEAGAWRPGGDPAPNPRPGPGWNGEPPRWVFNGLQHLPKFGPRPSEPRETPYVTGDVNGDGRSDWIKVGQNDDNGPARVEISVGLSNRNWGPAVVTEVLPWPDPAGWGGWGDRGPQVWAADVNADGADDLVMTTGHRQGRPEVTGLVAPQAIFIIAALSQHDGRFRFVGTPVETPWIDNPYNSLSALYEANCQPGDPNGDGRADLVCAYTDVFVPHAPGAPVEHLGTALSKGDGTFIPMTEPAPDIGRINWVPELVTGDADGDGDGDVLLAYEGKWMTATSRGDGHYDFVDHQTNFCCGQGRLRSADVNGDGRVDFLRIVEYLNNSGFIHTLISRPDGTRTPVVERIPDRLVGRFPALDVHGTTGDADGDGAVDLLFAVEVDAHPATACAAAYAERHLSFARILGNGDGTFRWPVTWNDCGLSVEKDYRWAYLLDWRGFQAPDVNGDGLADHFGIYRRGSMLNAIDVVSPRTGADVARALHADVNGDGRSDLVYVHVANTYNTIYTLLRRPGNGGYDQRTSVVMQGDHDVVRNFKVGDVNGDGRADLTYVSIDFGDLYVDTLLSNGDGTWDERYRVAWRHYDLDNPGETGRDTPLWRVMDVDGDGRADLTHLYRTGSTLRINTLLSAGDGTWRRRSAPVPGEPLTMGVLSWQPADVNGDGRTDLVRLWPIGRLGARVDTLLSRGNGTSWRREGQPQWQPYLADATRRWVPADANGDGRTDLVRVDQANGGLQVRSLLSIGNGTWVARSAADVLPGPLKGTGSFADTARWRSMDVNRDGRADLVHLLPVTTPAPGLRVDTVVATGQGGWAARPPRPDALPGYDRPGALDWRPADADGDGAADLVRVARVPAGPRSARLRVSSLESRAPRDLVTVVDNGVGGHTEITYQPSSSAAPRRAPTSAYSGCALPVGVVTQLPSAVTQRIAGAQADRRRIAYACARWSNRDRRLLGWGETTVEHVAAANRPAEIAVSRDLLDDECLGRPGEVLLRNAAGRTITRTVTRYENPGLGVAARCRPDWVRTWRYDGPGADPSPAGTETRVVYSYDDFGNATLVGRSGDLDDPGDDRVVRRMHKPLIGPWLLDRPASEELLDGGVPGSRRFSLTAYCYDDANGTPRGGCIGAPVRGLGLLTAVKRLHDDGTYRTTTFGHDAYGNRTSVTDPRNNTSTTAYDPVRHLFPQRVCDALKHCLTYEWDRDQAQLTAVVDPNGARTEMVTDPLGRPETVRNPGRGLVTYAYLDWDDPARRRVRETIDDGTPDGLWSETYLDGLDRPTRLAREGDQPGRTFVQDTFYSDDSDRPAAQTTWWTLPAGAGPAVERVGYDEAGRVVTQTHADQSVDRWDYANEGGGTAVTRTDARGDSKVLVHDAHGRLTQVRQPDGARTSKLSYRYDAADHVRTVTDTEGHVATSEYDLLGNLTATDDPDLGRWSWTWDAAGNLDSQTDARGRTVRYTYDAVDRPATRRYRDGSRVVWHYDEAGHGPAAGRLTSVEEPTGAGCPGSRSRGLTYDQAGQAVAERRCVGGAAATMRFEFDGLGRQRAAVYPDGERQAYTYDDAGRLRDMPGLIGEFNHDPDGRTTRVERADSTITQWTYDPKRRRLTDVTTASPLTGQLLKLGYTYEPDGLVRTTTSEPGADLSYTYDGLKRMTEVNGDLTERVGWGADGDIGTYSEVGPYRYPAPGADGCVTGGRRAPCHGARSAGDQTYSYDANGNTTSVNTTVGRHYDVRAKRAGHRRDTLWAIARDHLGDPRRWPEIFALNRGRLQPQSRTGRFDDPHWIYPGQRLEMPAGAAGVAARTTTRTLVWDDDNRLVRSSGPTGPPTTMRYDADGDRVEKRTGAAVTRYLGRWLENAGAGGQTKYYWAGETLIARRDGRGLHFYHQDRLGSTRMLTAADGAVTARYGYHPGGAPLSAGGATSTDLRYAGQRRDAETGLDYAGARHLDPRTMRYLSPDPVLADLTSTQAANRYGYAYGDPVGNNDPSGRQPECPVCDEPFVGPVPAEGLPDGPQSLPEEWQPWPYAAPTDPNAYVLGDEMLVVGNPFEYIWESLDPAEVGRGESFESGGSGAVLGTILGRWLFADIKPSGGDWMALGGTAARSGARRSMAATQSSAVAPTSTSTAAPKAARLPQDVAANPAAPAALPLNRPIGTSPTQNAALQARIADLQAKGATDFRVNQQQVDVNGTRVGINRPDLQYTLNGQRQYEEFDRSTSQRGPAHQTRIEANDPSGGVLLHTVD
ncbi:FG-GAP-like repeat-containing protein [Actinoplanes sp. NPDC049118]|uniref:FG-GAP-like repeat-containing protein n=1 Tax=Actinoplanes sp. NPDC049118 TaxID=3155769 RepID=UPI0033F3F8EF